MKYTSDQVEQAAAKVTEWVHDYAPDGEFLAVAYRQVAIDATCSRNELLEALKEMLDLYIWDSDASDRAKAAIANAEAL